jgi:hypothetical protein
VEEVTMLRRGFLGGLALVLAASVWAADRIEPPCKATPLSLTTDYLFDKIDVASTSRGAHCLWLNVTLDGKGGGKGTLTLDPNRQDHNAFGDPTSVTEIATRALEVRLTALRTADPAKKGRILYEITADKLTSRLFLVYSPGKAGPHRLILADRDGHTLRVFQLHNQNAAK